VVQEALEIESIFTFICTS